LYLFAKQARVTAVRVQFSCLPQKINKYKLKNINKMRKFIKHIIKFGHKT